jgi:alkylation response protein AidB-like acyl-CoA dehydrogenase
MPFTLYGRRTKQTKILPKLASGEWFGAYCLTEPGAGSEMLTLENESSFIRRRKHTRLQVKNGFQMQVSVAFIVLHVLVMIKNITGFIVENDPSNGITMNEEEHKLGIRVLLVKFSSTKQKFLLKTCYQIEETDLQINVGRIVCCCLS